jgi:hypothetical protein
MSMFRNIFCFEDEPTYWKEAVKHFKNKVPRFDSKEETIAFIERYCTIGSNPEEPHLNQSVSLLTSWEQIEKYLLPKIDEYYDRWEDKLPSPDMVHQNRYIHNLSEADTAANAKTSSTSNDEIDIEKEKAIKQYLKTTSWRRFKTEDGQVYYHDKTANATVWDPPACLQTFVAEYDRKQNKLEKEDSKAGTLPSSSTGNNAAYEYLQSRMNLPIHTSMNKHSTMNTLKYLFYHMRCGIYVMIRNNQVCIFAPFVNKDYSNNWADVDTVYGQGLKLESADGSISSYYAEKEQHYRKENVLKDKSQWWANGNIICNEHEKPEDSSAASVGNKGKNESTSQYWGDQFLLQLKDMLCETCNAREVPDCAFFINKRDYPQLKVHEGSTDNDHNMGMDIDSSSTLPERDIKFQLKDQLLPEPAQKSHKNTRLMKNMPVEPYGFIFDKDDTKPDEDIPLSRYFYISYAPILSFYTSQRFADIPMPPSEDWESACGEIFPPSFKYTVEGGGSIANGAKIEVGNPRDLFTAKNLKKFETAWSDKVNTAFFRGTATGGGTTIYTNQRLHAAQLCYDWTQEEFEALASSKGKGEKIVPYLDAKITGWNMRDKKIASSKMTFVRKSNFPFEGDRKKNFVEIYKQGTYKYLLYIEGHCAACRYGFMMQLGSVILKVDSKCVADSMWYFPLLKPYYDHVPVKADLSDLKEKIDWCRNHDEECKTIASNAQQVYKQYVSRDGVVDYMQAIFYEISKRYRHSLPFGMTPQYKANIHRHSARNFECCMPNCNQSCDHLTCAMCDKTKIEEQTALALAREMEGNQKLAQADKRAKLRNAQRERAKKLAASKGNKDDHIGGSPKVESRKREREP